jgi:hypothetical protein
MQGESSGTAGYYYENAASTHNEYQIAEATIGALSNLATATAADQVLVVALTEANSRLAKQLEDHSTELRELKALLNKERRENSCLQPLTKKLLLDSWLQSQYHSQEPHLQTPKTRPQIGGH